ncbi:ABC transporter ATP-binding protein [Roseateles toxinivorans]|uniref:Peptide/nickel transport system ATP-binding protein n=1 Tax=Roseateles toxinivorans TaxID=270368 RepID=A0A4V3CSE7_9BURK|nr:ABC transporter ATP-binding protein [Roseateles toxinivorans]TDP60412.1 peptide/nickel transport system ATP-binding protein [Roseateles toxinivorans]
MTNPLLVIDSLHVAARRDGARRELLRDVSLDIAAGEIAGLVGESGSGKSMLGSAIGGLLPRACAPTSGRVLWRGRDLLQAAEVELAALRGAQIAYVFQEPMTALNPTLRLGRQLTDVIRRHGTGADATATALKLLADVRIEDPQQVFDAWPHQLSGGMRQRVLIAMAFSCRPALIVADEPTTALDVTVQAQVLTLLLALAREHGTAVLLISHDISVIRRACETVHVMYAGRIVERGPTAAVLGAPRHPYTRALLDCLPGRAQPKARLTALPPAGAAMPGCAFRARCPAAFERCEQEPPLGATSATGAAACWLNHRSESASHEGTTE